MSESGLPGSREESYRAGMMTTAREGETEGDETVAVPWGVAGCTANITTWRHRLFAANED